jgi:hypothetical protein
VSEQDALAESLRAAAEERRGVNQRTALYRLYDADGVLLYVGITKNTEQRWAAHKKYKSWWPKVARRGVAWLDSRPSALLAEHIAIISEHPLHNDPRDPQGLAPGVKSSTPTSADDEAIGRRLRDAQAGIALLEAARLRRQAAVMAAKNADWSKYKIAAVLGVERPTVDSIITAAKRAEAAQKGNGL